MSFVSRWQMFILWLKYWLIWPGVRQLGHPAQMRLIIVLASGRRIMPDEDRWRVGNRFVSLNRDDRLMLQELRQSTQRVQPGPHNIQTAEIVWWLWNNNALAFVVPWEVALALTEDQLDAIGSHLHIVWPSPDRSATLNVRDMFLAALRQHPNPVPTGILAHQWFIVRALLMWHKLTGQSPLAPPSHITGPDPESSQPHFRSWLHWWPREARARVHHVLYRWV